MMTISEMIEDYARYRKVCGMKDLVQYHRLRQLVHNAKRLYGADELRQELIDWWWSRRDTENDHSYVCRIVSTVPFLRYVVDNGMASVALPPFKAKFSFSAPSAERFATPEEYSRFFKAVYELPVPKGLEGRGLYDVVLRNLSMLGIFLILRSLGLRPNEGRLLHRKDINWSTGEITIRETKGYRQHRVFAPETLLAELARIDKEIDRVVPGRDYMFPDADGRPRPAHWLSSNFRVCWDRCNDSRKVVPYTFRHQYVIENIYSWKPGDNVNARLLALSKSLGHGSLASTCYYFDLVPPSVANQFNITLNLEDPVQLGTLDGGQEHGK